MKARMNSFLLRASSTDIELLRQARVSINSLPYEAVEINNDGATLTRRDGVVMKHTTHPAKRVDDSLLKNLEGSECGHFSIPPKFGIDGKAVCPLCGIRQAWEVPVELFWEEVDK